MSATDELRRLLDERGVEWWPMHDDEAGYRDDRDTEFLVYGCKHVAHEWGCRLQVDMLTPEQAIAATLGANTSAARLAERLHDISDEMRDVGASSMTPHELLACYAIEVDKVVDSLKFAATLGSDREAELEALAKDLYENAVDFSFKGWMPYYEARFAALGIEVEQ